MPNTKYIDIFAYTNIFVIDFIYSFNVTVQAVLSFKLQIITFLKRKTWIYRFLVLSRRNCTNAEGNAVLNLLDRENLHIWNQTFRWWRKHWVNLRKRKSKRVISLSPFGNYYNKMKWMYVFLCHPQGRCLNRKESSVREVKYNILNPCYTCCQRDVPLL